MAGLAKALTVVGFGTTAYGLYLQSGFIILTAYFVMQGVQVHWRNLLLGLALDIGWYVAPLFAGVLLLIVLRIATRQKL